jgi:hypothetical protein
LCLVCHREDCVTEVYDELVKAAEGDPKFARRAAESSQGVLGFKKKSAKLLRGKAAPSSATVERLSRKLWEFGEQVRLEALERAENVREQNDRSKNARRLKA